MTDPLLQFASHAPPVPEWYTVEVKATPVSSITDWQGAPSAMSGVHPKFRDEAVSAAFQRDLAELNKDYHAEVAALPAKRLASWPWYYAQMVMEARPDTEGKECSLCGAAWSDGRPIIVPPAASTPYPSDD